ncbi:LPXTG cell wall anchor domain-containing protein [Lactobacillus sp. PV012]|nr:LPXTG cell wall anchor domain-containing protein [Lactobacillus sp. PV012]
MTAPAEAGYTVSNPDAAPEVAVTGDTSDSTVTFTYTANEQTRKINFVEPSGKTVGTQTVSGKTGTSVTIGNNSGDTPLNIPSGYEVVPNTKVPTTVPFNADSKDNGDITVKVQPKIDVVDGGTDKNNSDVYHQVTRTITANIEGKKPQVVTQTLDFYRTKSTNEVTGEVTYTDWTSNMTDNSISFPEVEIPSAGGYTRTITGGEITTKDGKDYVASANGLSDGSPVNNVVVTVNYTKAEQTATIKFVNNADHNDVVSTQKVPGEIGETIPVTLQVPANWQVVGGQQVPSSFTFGSTPLKDTIVYVEHATKDPSQADKVNKTVTRTINYVNPVTNKIETYKIESVTLHRTATEDLVTGEVTYSAWNTKDAKFDAVTAPEIAGYTVTNPDAASEVAVTGNTSDSTVTFTYTANDHTQVINYVDPAGKIIKTYKVNGKTNETVLTNIQSNVPEGWVITNKTVPDKITFGSNNPAPIIIYVEKEVKPTIDSGKNIPAPEVNPDTSTPATKDSGNPVTPQIPQTSQPTISTKPVPNPIVVPTGKLPEASTGIKNKTDFPKGTKYTWKKTPETAEAGKITGTVVVTYPNGETLEVPVIITVAPHAKDTKGESKVHRTPAKLRKTYTTRRETSRYLGNSLSVKEKKRFDQRNLSKGKNNQAKVLPQTGNQANKASVLGLMIASVGAILGLAVSKKQRK